MYKYGSGYDNIINVNAEIEFINTFLRGCTDYDIAQRQLEVLYGREISLSRCNDVLNFGVCTEIHEYILTNIYMRNKLIIQRCLFIAKGVDDGVSEEEIEKKVDEYDSQIMDYTVEAVEWVINDAQKHSSYSDKFTPNGHYSCLGWFRNIGLYQEIYFGYNGQSDGLGGAKEKVFSYCKYNYNYNN